MDDSKRMASVRKGSDFGDTTPEVKYNMDDHLGSSNLSVDENGTLVNREEYYPFGETSFGSYGKKRYRFCGKEKDEESGLYYYGARYYSPWTCRFISVDPLAEKYAHLTPYNYAGNKVINYIDIDGMQGSGEKTTPEGGGSSVWSTSLAEAIAKLPKVNQIGNFYKNLNTGEVQWNALAGKNGEKVSLKGSTDTWENLGNNINSAAVIEAVGSHIMNGGGWNAFMQYYKSSKFGEKFFFTSAETYNTNASGFMKSLINQVSSIKDGLILSIMTHDWVDNAGWTKERNELEHQIGMFLMSSKWGQAEAKTIGFGNELRGLLINDKQSGNIWNALTGQTTNTGGPTAFEWQDLKSNEKGISLFTNFSKTPNANKYSSYLNNLPKEQKSWQTIRRSWKTGL
jgi:RHS repeat-associated protein